MTYRITGLDPAAFAPLHLLSDAELAEREIVRMTVTQCPDAPCRITLDDVLVGGEVLLLNHQSVASGPYRTSHAIFVSEAQQAASYRDTVPPALARRVLSLRAFDAAHDMRQAVLAAPGEADAKLTALLADPETAYIHAHYATRGCFAARVERD
ncbi:MULTISPECIES: DUF1203 domain-containing protein [Sphingomonas]|uniref:DUF1203 domain-containing protein n=1 Tax=Sphingomonas TaxID=13687 RepID=UPI000DEECA6C|nr:MULTISPECIES: DUF1203 domain-containing protein [Sphingomonas]